MCPRRAADRRAELPASWRRALGGLPPRSLHPGQAQLCLVRARFRKQALRKLVIFGPSRAGDLKARNEQTAMKDELTQARAYADFPSSGHSSQSRPLHCKSSCHPQVHAFMTSAASNAQAFLALCSSASLVVVRIFIQNRSTPLAPRLMQTCREWASKVPAGARCDRTLGEHAQFSLASVQLLTWGN